MHCNTSSIIYLFEVSVKEPSLRHLHVTDIIRHVSAMISKRRKSQSLSASEAALTDRHSLFQLTLLLFILEHCSVISADS
jgi:hypothetical protein